MKIVDEDQFRQFVILDADGRVTEISNGAYETFGLDDSKVGVPISTFLHAPLNAPEEAGSISVLEGTPGTFTPVIVQRTILTGTQAVQLCALTDDESFSNNLAATASLPGQLVSELPVGIVIQFQDSRILSANSAAAKILGLSIDELLGRTSIDPRWRAIQLDGTPLPGEHHPAMICLRTGVTTHAVFGVVTPLDGRRWIDVTAQPLIAHDSHVFATVVSFIDITAEVDSFTEAQRTVTRFETLLSESSSLVLVCGLTGVITYVAPVATGSGAAYLVSKIGENFLTFVSEDDRPEVSRLFTLLASRSRSQGNCTVKLNNAAGVPRWFELSLRNLIDEPTVFGLVITGTDIHDRVLAAEELSALNDELHRRLEEQEAESQVDRELNAAAELISKCRSLSELDAVLLGATQRIFPENHPQLFKSLGGNVDLEAIGEVTGEKKFLDPGECWALRTNQLHLSVGSNARGLRCTHLPPSDDPSLCVPLGAASSGFGLLVLTWPTTLTQGHAESFVNRIVPILSIASGLID